MKSKLTNLLVLMLLTLVLAACGKDSEESTVASDAADAAKEVGKEIATRAKAKKVNNVVFDRNGFIYTGRIAALAESAREAGLKF